jgi:adenosylmethionine-8-amino-7-oxononanoate aminotransferase
MISAVRQAGALVFADEVMTGFYRTGRLFASEWVEHAQELPSGTERQKPAGSLASLDLRPDLMSLSKGLTGGMMALGITACRDAIYQAFYGADKSLTFFHGHSYTANPLACSVALASLELTLSNETAKAVSRISTRQSAFVQTISNHPRVEHARSQGTIWAFDWNSGPETSYFHPIRDQLYRFFLKRDLLLRPLGNTLYTMPPYCFGEEHLDAVEAAVLALLDSDEVG